ncbi:alpha/beta fold hydrolase [Streptomyces sp. 3MP-14]|uniref:Alpha/beta fold hydrolase n=1 Tax=Streptomyces mimosae TaxID=2586635 RepID=A0A5N6A825_9ACTN|nr:MULTISPECIES: alpha/beta fold hydrolase [Streptomyces]KAB8164515.1 alpha/beta fold hydrolase [Streptomyces mimosae]KAB8175431.1 alpha/beta fold hydrolase [Streptomyces sp. 3MP-14]
MTRHDPAPGGVCLLLPGMLCSARLWQAQQEALSRHAETRVVELTADSVASMADQVLDLPYERFALGGLSLGGIVAMTVAHRAPERVSRLALLSTSARPPRAEQRAGWDVLTERTVSGGFADITPKTLLPQLVHPARVREPALAGTVVRMADEVGPEVFLRQLSAQRSRTDLRGAVRELRCPTLVVAGADDALAPVAAHEEIAALVPGARLAVVPDSGHLTPLERPAEVTELLTGWLLADAHPAHAA